VGAFFKKENQNKQNGGANKNNRGAPSVGCKQRVTTPQSDTKAGGIERNIEEYKK
jgi:hypothetical protein